MDGHLIYMHIHAKNNDFPIDFAIFTTWLQRYGRTDGQTDGQKNGQTHRIMDGQTNEWIDMQYACKDMKKTMIFQ